MSGHSVPVYFLDTALPENGPWDQTLTDHLYGGDEHYHLCQEVILGFGGLAMLQILGLDTNIIYHMNEGHAALLALSLLEQRIKRRGSDAPTQTDVDVVGQQCVFTPHTPFSAGHDQFSKELVQRVLGMERAALLEATQCYVNGNLNMTYLGLSFARYLNGVSIRHDEISTGMFPGYPINAITNGDVPPAVVPSFKLGWGSSQARDPGGA